MTTAAYDSIAEWYDQSIRAGTLLSADDLLASAAFEMIGSVAGRRVCDLACGQGEMARQLARHGAQVVGVDISSRLLEIARREEATEPLGIVYHHADAQALPPLNEELFDGVLCHMALMDIPDLAAAIRSVASLLRPDGWFVASITHPCFQMPSGRGYYEEGFWRSDNLNGVRGKVGAHHRTLSRYLNVVGAAGLLTERIAEPHLSNRDVPPVLVMQCRKVERRW